MSPNAVRTFAFVALRVSMSAVVAQERGNRDDAKAMLDAALVHIKKVRQD